MQQFSKSVTEAGERFGSDDFARIENGKLRLRHDDKGTISISVTNLQKAIDSSMPLIRIEKLLMEVD
jgi:hypothetical protein